MRATCRLRMILRTRAGAPLASKRFRLQVDGAPLIEGRTGGDGAVEASVPVEAHFGKLEVWARDEDVGPAYLYQVRVGGLEPHDELSGVQGRLHNLGYGCAVTGSLDDATRRALRFRADQDLSGGDELDDAAKDAIKDAHGGR